MQWLQFCSLGSPTYILLARRNEFLPAPCRLSEAFVLIFSVFLFSGGNVGSCGTNRYAIIIRRGIPFVVVSVGGDVVVARGAVAAFRKFAHPGIRGHPHRHEGPRQAARPRFCTDDTDIPGKRIVYANVLTRPPSPYNDSISWPGANRRVLRAALSVIIFSMPSGSVSGSS